MRPHALLLAASLIFSAPAVGQTIGWLEGSWRGSGTSFGQPGEAALVVRPVLGGKFLELSYSVSTSGPKPFRFEGRAFYSPAATAGWKAQWFDSRGVTMPISAALSEGSLVSSWASATEQGQTVYRLRPDGKLEVADSVRSGDGAWREFARYVYEKTP